MSDRVSISVNRITQVAFLVATTLLILFFGILIWSVASGSPDHEDLLERQEMMDHQLTYISCLLLIPENERVPEVVAACQVAPEDLAPSTSLADE